MRCMMLIAVIIVLNLLTYTNSYALQYGWTCTGGHLYFDYQSSDGTWNCHEVAGGCGGGDWSWYGELIAFNPNSSNNNTEFNNKFNKGIPLSEIQEVNNMFKNIKEENFASGFKVEKSVFESWMKRQGSTIKKNKISINLSMLPNWLIKKINNANGSLRTTTAGYPPNGYPCLGCHPCPPDYCSDFPGSSMIQSDLSSVAKANGYKVVNGKIVIPNNKR